MNGHVNRHNCVYYAVENPHIVITEEMNALGVTVWEGIWSGVIIGPFFFRDTVTADSYLEKLNKEIVPAIDSQMNLTKIFYMHDGASAHYAKSARDFLDDKFHNQWIGRHGPIEWPARSPDLTPTDFFSMGFSQRPCVCDKVSKSSSTQGCYYYRNTKLVNRIMSTSVLIGTCTIAALQRLRR